MVRKTIAVLTSGGDAPGMNAAIRAVVRSAIFSGFRAVGVRRGFNGLIKGDVFELNLRSVSHILSQGGTVLYSARSSEFMTDNGQNQAVETCKSLGIDCVVVIGGDGSFNGALALSKKGIPCIGIPGTIDNDIQCSEYTIGFDTAMNTAMEMVDKIRDTTESHDRCSIVEVMGRRCGDLALKTGIAVGATAILIPEVKIDIQRDVIDRINFVQKTSKRHFIIIVAEGVGGIDNLADQIEKGTGIATRSTILGHVQRGGSPTLQDRVMGSLLGSYAIKIFEEELVNRVVAIKNGKVTNYAIDEALKMKKNIDYELYGIAMKVSI